MENNELYFYHHGIKGMRWGVRRYQNKDGSLTPAGKKRAAKLEAQYEKTTGKKLGESSASSSTKTIKDMSEQELASGIRRIQLEQQYSTLMSQQNAKKVSRGKQFVSDLINKAVIPGITDASKRLITDYTTKLGKQYLGLNEKDTGDALKKAVENLELQKRKSEAENYFKNQSKKPDEDEELKKEVNRLMLKKRKKDLEKELS